MKGEFTPYESALDQGSGHHSFAMRSVQLSLSDERRKNKKNKRKENSGQRIFGENVR